MCTKNAPGQAVARMHSEMRIGLPTESARQRRLLSSRRVKEEKAKVKAKETKEAKEAEDEEDQQQQLPSTHQQQQSKSLQQQLPPPLL